MEDLEIIQLSDYLYSLPLHIVRHQEAGGQVGTYKHLNDVTSNDGYPLPQFNDFNGNF